MKRYGNLFNKIADIDNILRAHENARKGKVNLPEVKMVDADKCGYCEKIQKMLFDGTFTTSPYHVFILNERGKDREICDLPYYPDRIVQWAILQIIEPMFMSHFIEQTYAALPKRGSHKALYKLHDYMNDRNGTYYCLKMDVRKFFPSIDIKILKEQLRRRFKDVELLRVLDDIADSYANGIPIGNYTSQYYGNYYLSFFDHWLKEQEHIKYYLRYMDDMIILHESKEYLHNLHREIDDYLTINLHLDMKDNWQVFPTYVRGVDFVGYRSFGDFTLLRTATKKRLKQAAKRLVQKQKNGEPLNTSDKCVIGSYHGILSHCNSYRLRQNTLNKINYSRR